MKNSKRNICKILFVFMACAIIGAGLFGCSPITLETTQTSSGAIVSTLTLDFSDITVNKTSKMSAAQSISNKYVEQMTAAYEDRMIELFDNKYHSADLGITSVHDKMAYIQARNPKYAEEVNVIGPTSSTGGYEPLVQPTQNTITIEAKFYSIYAYIMYFYPNAFMWSEEKQAVVINNEVYNSLTDIPVSSVSLEKDEKLFFVTWTQICAPFTYNGEEPKLLSSIRVNAKDYAAGTTIVAVACDAMSLSADEAEYLFNFVTAYKRVWSDGNVSISDGKFVHSWNFGSNIMGQVSLSRKYANYATWYIAGLILGLATIGIGSLVVVLVRASRRKRGMEAMQNIADLISTRSTTQDSTQQDDDPSDQ